MQTINQSKSRPRISTWCLKLLKKQRADSLSSAWRRQRGNPLYLAVHDLGVSVRVLHDLRRVHGRSKSGSFVHGRFSGGNETF